MAGRLPGLISDFSEKRIKHAAYELALLGDAIVTSSSDPSRKIVERGRNLFVPPGQFAELLSEETVEVPLDSLAFISIKYRYKRRGLVNISGFHVDPGYRGRLRFSVHNAGPNSIVLTAGEPTFLIWYASLDGETADAYNGSHQGQKGVRDEDLMLFHGDVMSVQHVNAKVDETAQELRTRIDVLEGRVGTMSNVAMGLGSAILVLLLGLVLGVWLDRSSPSVERTGATVSNHSHDVPSNVPQGPSGAAADPAEGTANPGIVGAGSEGSEEEERPILSD